jgi:(p)ppGpp synthase/HD superfamily hydrolase
MLTERYKTALQFAARVHDGHVRKGTQVAYLSHLLAVSALVMENGGSEDEAIAALLHDSIEDQGHDYESLFHVEPKLGREALKRDIELQFGTAVLSIVRQCTDDEYLPAGRPTEKGSVEEWHRRKQAYVAGLKQKSDLGALRVSCADKLHNARAIFADYEVDGEKLWQRFTAKSKTEQLWYYSGLVDAFVERSLLLGDEGLQRLARQLAATVEAIARHEPG